MYCNASLVVILLNVHILSLLSLTRKATFTLRLPRIMLDWPNLSRVYFITSEPTVDTPQFELRF